ncbi:hypothetical protein KNE206_38480 [Kitasatospora sp. NE20-6]
MARARQPGGSGPERARDTARQGDCGGPVLPTQAPRSELPLADFRFSQDENHDAVQEVSDGAGISSDWVPTLMDYLYISVTTYR